MKKLFYFILLAGLVCCCGRKIEENQVVIYYPSKDLFTSNDLIKIDLHNPKLNFKRIKHLINDIHIKDSTPYILIKNKDTIRKIMPLRNDWGYKAGKNILRIVKDSIYKAGKHSISELDRLLKKHYENNGKDPRYSQRTERAWVEIEIDTNASGVELKKILHIVTRAFDKINKYHQDSLKLKIGLSYFHQIPPPPPPPKEFKD